MPFLAKTSLTCGLAVQPALTNLLTELPKRADRANHLMEPGFQVLAILQPAMLRHTKAGEDRQLFAIDHTALFITQLTPVQSTSSI
jgi:hypothetical protein